MTSAAGHRHHGPGCDRGFGAQGVGAGVGWRCREERLLVPLGPQSRRTTRLLTMTHGDLDRRGWSCCAQGALRRQEADGVLNSSEFLPAVGTTPTSISCRSPGPVEGQLSAHEGHHVRGGRLYSGRGGRNAGFFLFHAEGKHSCSL